MSGGIVELRSDRNDSCHQTCAQAASLGRRSGGMPSFATAFLSFSTLIMSVILVLFGGHYLTVNGIKENDIS